MTTSRLIYRTRQFFQAISSHSSQVDLELIASILNPSQLALFQEMQTSEQLHSQRVFNELRMNGETNQDLLVAALLHDAGKTRAPLLLGERVLIVLVKSICPGCVMRWGHVPNGQFTPTMGIRRPFVISVQHPGWGAELADQCGSSQLAVELIARHEEHLIPSPQDGITLADQLLLKLQAADGNN